MPPNQKSPADDDIHYLPSRKDKVIEPLHGPESEESSDDTVALNLIRQKLAHIYDEEPDAKKEIAEEESHHGRRSKHQQYMHEISHSGKSLAEIQTAWHNYYQQLPDNEKHEVWQEFYSNYNRDM